MTSNVPETKSQSEWMQQPASDAKAGHQDPVLCNHCGRTASNGIRCLGMCVADSDY